MIMKNGEKTLSKPQDTSVMICCYRGMLVIHSTVVATPAQLARAAGHVERR
jgi:hypothetical protein